MPFLSNSDLETTTYLKLLLFSMRASLSLLQRHCLGILMSWDGR